MFNKDKRDTITNLETRIIELETIIKVTIASLEVFKEQDNYLDKDIHINGLLSWLHKHETNNFKFFTG